MQFRQPATAAAGLCAAFLLLQPVMAQQNTAPASPAPTNPAAKPAANSAAPGTSQATVTVPAAAPADDTGGKRDESSIRVQVNEVIVPVTVTDEKGRFVSDLDQKDFHI